MATKIWDGGAGDNAIGTAANWVGDAAPSADDDLIIPKQAAATTKDIAGSDYKATDLNSWTSEDGCALNIGSATAFLQLDMNDAKPLNIGGSGYHYLDVSNTDAGGGLTLLVTSAAVGSSVARGLNLKGSGVIATTNIRADANQTVSLASNAGETGSYTTVNVYSGTVYIGSGATISTLNVYGGTVYCEASIATVLQQGGRLYLRKAVACSTSLTVRGGQCYEQSSGTKAHVYIADDGQIDAKECPGATWTDTDLYGTQCKLGDANQKLTPTNAITLNYAKLSQIDRGEHMNVALTAAS